MSELGDLLELMHDARNRWRTVRATFRRWQHYALSQKAWERHERAGDGVSRVQYAFGDGDEPTPETSESTTEVWLDAQRAREEHSGDWGPRSGIRVGEIWWSYDEHSGAITNEEMPEVGSGIGDELRRFLDSARLIGALDFELLGRITQAGRSAIRVRALARALEQLDWMAELPVGADEYELVVDEERGVLLKQVARLDGQDYSVVEVTEIRFDEEFPPETFVFEPPPGEEIRSVGERVMPRTMSIDEAQREAAFTVWIPSQLDAGWQMRVHHLSGRDRPAMPGSVSIHYFRMDATRQFTLHETATGEEQPFGEHWQSLDRNDETLRVWEPEEDSTEMPSRVQIERDGTRITLHSSDLSLDELLGLVDLLVVAPSEPPPLTRSG